MRKRKGSVYRGQAEDRLSNLCCAESAGKQDPWVLLVTPKGSRV